MRYRWVEATTGWRSPQIMVQVTPFQWKLAIGVGGSKFGLGIGPVSVAIYWGCVPFETYYDPPMKGQ